MAAHPYVRRLTDPLLAELFAAVPCIMLVGPRAAGKTTTARRMAADVLRLDDPAVAAVVAADPDAALRRSKEPVLVDEWQEVPSVLGAVKRAIDDEPRPGRFLLTGSVEADLTAATWPGTGRVVRVVMHGLTRREIDGQVDSPGVLAAAGRGDLSAVRMPSDPPDLDGYLALAVAGGLPESALGSPGRARRAWQNSYVEHVVTRDVLAAGQVRDPVRLRRYLEALALSTAGVPTEATLQAASDIDRRTAAAYDRLLTTLFLVDQVPAWNSNRINRLVKRPKRYLVDAGIAMAAARIDEATVLTEPDLLGRFLDTFVAAQIRPEADLLEPAARLHHLRAEDGRREVDLVVDLGRGRVIGVEVKASSTITRRDVRHLAWLRDELGDSFVRGIVFHTGPQPYEFDTRIWALPVATLWG